jgi:hypothetical protein
MYDNEKEFNPDEFVEKKTMVETVITTTETGFAVSLKNKRGCETVAFPFKNVEMVDYDDHFDENDITVIVLFKSGRDIRFKRSYGITPEDLKKIWETLVDNM